MKTIASPAMEAIEAGEAIVTGAVEIVPRNLVSYTTVGIYNIDALTDAATTAANAISGAKGEVVLGFAADDIVRVTLPTGQTYVAWSAWGVPALGGSNTGSAHRFNVIPGGVAADMFEVGTNTLYNGYEAARAAFGSHTFSGATSYRLYINDSPFADNSGGVSIKVERGVVSGTGSPIRVWGGYGPIEIDGEEYLGVGDRAIAQQTSGAIGGVAQGITLSLSGVEADLVGLIDANEIKGGSVVLRRMIFASDGKTLLDAHVFDRGRVDTVETAETIGGAASVQVMVESAARGLGRSLSRQRADSDQRLIEATDGYFKNTAFAGEKMLYWGGRKPSRMGDGI